MGYKSYNVNEAFLFVKQDLNLVTVNPAVENTLSAG